MEKENYIQIMLSNVEKQFNKIRADIGILDLRKEENNWKNLLQEVFIINEFINFLKNEYERTTITSYEIKTSVPLADYEIITNNNTDVVESLLSMYWNSDTGTSYHDLAEIVKEIAEDIRECQEWEQEQGQTD